MFTAASQLYKAAQKDGNYANKITLNNGTLVFSKAVRKFQTCELDYHHLIHREGNNTWCSLCSFNAFTSDGKISNMITHIKREHPEHLPYSDMLESYKNQNEREWEEIDTAKTYPLLVLAHNRVLFNSVDLRFLWKIKSQC